MSDVVFAGLDGWAPAVVRTDDALLLRVVGGADALHGPRTFLVPITERHLEALRNEPARHLLMWSALGPLCDTAGIGGPLDQVAAAKIVDAVLLGSPEQVRTLFARIRWDRSRLVAHGADRAALDRGDVWQAVRSAGGTPDWDRARSDAADRHRAARGVTLTELDAAVLHYTGQYLHAATVPRRTPQDVPPDLLPRVMAVIGAAERACADLRIPDDPRLGRRASDKAAWRAVEAAVEAALAAHRPALSGEVVRSVAFLMCSETVQRTRDEPAEPGSTRNSPLLFTDDQEAEQRWDPAEGTDATTAFWQFVAERSSGSNEVFTIEDETAGEGLQLLFYADGAARIRAVGEVAADREPTYAVEYALVDGLDRQRALVDTFVAGGHSALDPFGPWMDDVADFERAHRRRAGR